MTRTTNPKPLRAGCNKTELARAYFPNTVSDETARRNLVRWVKMNPEIVSRLQATGYRDRQKFYTPEQVAIIIDVLGEPGE